MRRRIVLQLRRRSRGRTSCEMHGKFGLGVRRALASLFVWPGVTLWFEYQKSTTALL